MKNLYIILFLFLLYSPISFSQNIGIKVDTLYAAQGALVNVGVRAGAPFTNLMQFQFSLNWDTSIIEFVEIAAENPVDIQVGPSMEVINETGKLRIVGNDLETLSLEENALLFELTFLAKGDTGAISPIEITGDPLDIRFLTMDDPNYPDSVYTLNPFIEQGFLRIASPLIVDAILNNVSSPCINDGFIGLNPDGGVPEYTFQWNGPDGFTANTPSIDSLAPGAYELILTDGSGATFEATYEIEGQPNLEITINANQIEFCEGETAMLEASSESIFQTYQWLRNGQDLEASTASLEVSTDGTYQLIATDQDGCTASASIIIEIAAAPGVEIKATNEVICEGNSTSLEVVATGGEILDVEWNTGETTRSIEVFNSDTYIAFAFNELGCAASDSISITFEAPEFDCTDRPIICVRPGEEVELAACEGGVRYDWIEAGATLSSDTIQNPSTTIESSSLFVCQIYDSNGCTMLDSIQIFTGENALEVIQNICLITPNGDQVNDWLEFPNLEKFPDNTLRIFNRWGGTVYQKLRYQSDEERWDGTSNGNELPAGVYFYVLSFSEGELKSSISIVR